MLLSKREPHMVQAPLGLGSTSGFFLSTITESFVREEQLLPSFSELCVSQAPGQLESALQVADNWAVYRLIWRFPSSTDSSQLIVTPFFLH